MDQLLEDHLKTGVTLVDFNAGWCGPCKAQAPVIKKLSKMYENRVAVIEIDIDNHRNLATQYMVQSIPTIIIFKDGKEVRRFVGLQPEALIVKALDHVL